MVISSSYAAALSHFNMSNMKTSTNFIEVMWWESKLHGRVNRVNSE